MGDWFSDNDFNVSGYKDVKNRFSVSKKAKKWIIIIAVVLVALSVLGSGIGFYMTYLKIAETGEKFVSVFYTNLVAKAATQAAGFVLLFVIFLINAMLARTLVINKFFSIAILKKKWPYIVLCIVFAIMASSILRDDLYLKLLMMMNGGSFNEVDPLFSRDIGYYVFSRPFLITAVNSLKGIIMSTTVILAVIYSVIFVKNGYKSLKDIIGAQTGAAIHIIVNLIIYLILMCISYRFSQESIMYSSFGSDGDIFGAGYIDANIWLNYYKFAPILVIAVVIAALFLIYRKKIMGAGITIAVVPAAAIIVSLAAGIVQSLVVSPNERNLQSKFIEHNMQATQRAYNLDGVADIEYSLDNNVTENDVVENKNIINNIRITDFASTLTAYNQLQYLRRYYTFNDVDIVPYTLNNKLTAVSVAAREMNKENVEETARSYANMIFRYTHGFGAVASPINRVTTEGQPEFFIKDIPSRSTEGMPEITQPRIYYGELTNDYVVVGGSNKELDYSEGVSDIENTYDGQSGIKMSLLNRLLFSIDNSDYRMFFSGNISADSKLLINRNILKRVQLAAPFFRYDTDPYIIITDDGQLKWIIDGYTTTSYYPYSQPHGDFNYIRNSVRAIVDAYNGEVKFYIIDETDPIVMTYKSIYPELFTDGDINENIADHIRVPEYMFNVQTQMYQRYHILNADKFYDKDDVWRIATEKYENNEVKVLPYFNIMSFDGEEELVLVLPYVLGDKHNMVGLLAQRTSREHYGELVLYRFPKSITVYGPLQIENKIDNDPDISREMTLWGQGGSSVIRGNLLVVPFENSLIYVEPVYITSQNNASLPELKRIVVAYKDAVAMENTLDEALTKVFAEAGIGMPQENSGENITQPQNNIINESIDAVKAAVEAYDKFKSASASNDWSAMGESLNELDKYINELR